MGRVGIASGVVGVAEIGVQVDSVVVAGDGLLALGEAQGLKRFDVAGSLA